MKPFTIIAIIIFILVSLFYLMRYALGWEVTNNSVTIPLVALLVVLFLRCVDEITTEDKHNGNFKKILITCVAIFILWFIISPEQLNSSACWTLSLIGGGIYCPTNISW